MTPEEARQQLIASLVEVGKQHAAGADGWQHSLLRTFREYSLAIGIDRKLLNPLQRMLFEVGNEILKARRRKDGKPGTLMPAGRSITLAVAAAAVTTLRERGDCSSIPEAERIVANATGIERKAVKGFRDTLNRGLVAGDVAKAYEIALADVRQWPTGDLLKSLGGTGIFVK
jgi:hypothetical protein